MAYAKKCDRCGTYFDWEPEGYNQIMIENSYATRSKLKKFDICPTCMERFTQWMNDKGVIVPVMKEEEEESHE